MIPLPTQGAQAAALLDGPAIPASAASPRARGLGQRHCQTHRVLRAPELETAVLHFVFTCHFLQPSQTVSRLALAQSTSTFARQNGTAGGRNGEV